MTTDIGLMSVAVLDESQAIVEAEWQRLNQDWTQWEHELADSLAELPAPRPQPAPRSNTIAAWRSKPTAIPLTPTSAAWPVRRSTAPRVLPTQRSPPADAGAPDAQ